MADTVAGHDGGKRHPDCQAERRRHRERHVGSRSEASRSRHWMTWSARRSSDTGIVRPIALTVLMLMTNSNSVGCSTGRSAGFAPRKAFALKVRRKEVLRLPACTHVARGARGRNGMGRAPLLFAPIDRSTARELARRALVESPAELRLHARRFLECGPIVGSSRARTRHRSVDPTV